MEGVPGCKVGAALDDGEGGGGGKDERDADERRGDVGRSTMVKEAEVARTRKKRMREEQETEGYKIRKRLFNLK